MVSALVPGSSSTEVGGNCDTDLVGGGDASEAHSSDNSVQDMEGDSDDSVSEFERNLRNLLPCLHKESAAAKIGKRRGLGKVNGRRNHPRSSMKKLVT